MWKFIKAGTEIDCELFGVKIFDYKWENTGQKAKVLDPVHKQQHVLAVYNVNINNASITFAAGEFSNGVYGFYSKE